MSEKKPAKKASLIDDLEAHISKLIKSTMTDSTATLTDKMKVVDRGLKLAQIKAKIDDDEDGAGFNEE